MPDSWLTTNTFHCGQFADIAELVAIKRRKQVKISLCLPTLNEEKTIGKEIVIMKSELMIRHPLLDEIVVIDSGSSDATLAIAASFGAKVHCADDILPQYEKYRGKGENLWKALYICEGDIIVYLDADIKNIHHRFAYGLIGPLLCDARIKYTKAFYDRPVAIGKSKVRPTGGGRVTELVIRPMFSLFFPELTQILQPLSGEYAGYREVFEKIPFPIGYGIETSMLLDICERWGLNVIAQVDLERRIHRNQDLKALGRMAFVIQKTFLHRLARLGIVDFRRALYDQIIQYRLVKDQLEPDVMQMVGLERPPIIELPEYQAKFGASTP